MLHQEICVEQRKSDLNNNMLDKQKIDQKNEKNFQRMNSITIDKDNQFAVNCEELALRYHPYFQRINTINIKNKKHYYCLSLTFLANPHLTVMDQFIYITGIRKEQIPSSSLFAEFLLDRVFSMLDHEKQDFIFKEIFSQPTLEHKIIFQKSYNLYKSIHDGIYTRDEVSEVIKREFKEIPLLQAFHQRKIQIEWFIKQNLYSLEIRTQDEKITSLNKIQQIYPQEIKFTHTHKGLPLIMLKKNSQQIYSLDDLIICRRNKSNFFPSPQQFAFKLFQQLLHFEETYGQCYPCLSTQNIEYQKETKNINIAKIPLIFQHLGLGNNPSNVENFLSRNFTKREFWIAPEQLKEWRRFTTQKTLMWGFLMIIDKYDQGWTFVEKASTKISVQQHIINLTQAIKQKRQSSYLGKIACHIIEFCRQHGYSEWRQERQRPSYKFLHNYFQQNQPNGLSTMKCKKLLLECIKIYHKNQNRNLQIVIHLLRGIFQYFKKLHPHEWYESKKQSIKFEKITQKIPSLQVFYDKRKANKEKWYQMLVNISYFCQSKNLKEELKVEVLEHAFLVPEMKKDVFSQILDDIFVEKKENYSSCHFRRLCRNQKIDLVDI